MASSSLNSGPCAYSSMLDVSTTGNFRMRAVCASISALRFISSNGMDFIQLIVPTWWSISSMAALSALNFSYVIIVLALFWFFEELDRFAVCVATNRTHRLARARQVGLHNLAKERFIGYTHAGYPDSVIEKAATSSN